MQKFLPTLEVQCKLWISRTSSTFWARCGDSHGKKGMNLNLTSRRILLLLTLHAAVELRASRIVLPNFSSSSRQCNALTQTLYARTDTEVNEELWTSFTLHFRLTGCRKSLTRFNRRSWSGEVKYFAPNSSRPLFAFYLLFGNPLFGAPIRFFSLRFNAVRFIIETIFLKS